ncbi:hypothetical protein BDL97_01G135900 [Sphagnum fallax]|nr:hypothetical protein BDL97_01G135900 [Sphagnum fallax]KAH8975052.1 hypothetical protein BDL97_01G135900 [Sphagnum fallax]KAH8975053.1 hypothetical protein BDL97_01G135900 [Sphagnum fallax]
MQGLARLVQVQGRALSASLLQHIRLGGSALSSTIQARKESGQPDKESLEEHGFERSTIADILKEKGQKADGSWLWCTVDQTVYDAVKQMTSHNVGALLVLKRGEKALAGIITERDYLRKIIVQGRSSKTTKVGDIMTEENKLITVSPDTKVLRAMELMTDNRIRHIPVVENKEMKGMVSIGDVVRAVVDEHREELQRLNSFIQGSY